MPVKKIELTQDPIWERQPGEPKGQFEAFHTFMMMGPARRLPNLAEKLGKSVRTVWHYSTEGKWDERLTAWLDHEARADLAELNAKRQAAAEQDGAILRLGATTVASELQRLAAQPDLTVDQTIRLLDVTMKYRRMLYGDPADALPASVRPSSNPGAPGSPDAPMQVEVRHFMELSDEGKLNALRDLIQSNQQWLAAAEDQDDD